MNNKKIIFDYSKQSKKFFSKHNDIKNKFKDNIINIVNGTKSNVDIKKLAGNDFYFRMRINKYRVIYMVINQEIVVIKIIKADSRGDVYKKF